MSFWGGSPSEPTIAPGDVVVWSFGAPFFDDTLLQRLAFSCLLSLLKAKMKHIIWFKFYDMKGSGSKHLVSTLCLHFMTKTIATVVNWICPNLNNYITSWWSSHLTSFSSHPCFVWATIREQVQTSEKVHTYKYIKHVIYITSINTNISSSITILLQHLSSHKHANPPKKNHHSYLFPNRCPSPPRDVGNSFHQRPAAPPLRSVASGDENFNT